MYSVSTIKFANKMYSLSKQTTQIDKDRCFYLGIDSDHVIGAGAPVSWSKRISIITL